MLTSNTNPEILNQYQKDPTARRRFFKALQEGDLGNALQIMDVFEINPDTVGGILSSSALFYVATSGDLDPALTEALLRKGANPNLKNSALPEERTVLEELIHTGYYYYSSYRMHRELENNLFKTIELLAAFGGTCREDLFEILQKSPIYDESRDYTKFNESILGAIKKGQATFKQQKEKCLSDGLEYLGQVERKECQKPV